MSIVVFLSFLKRCLSSGCYLVCSDLSSGSVKICCVVIRLVIRLIVRMMVSVVVSVF